jgi:hypothetical protein
MAINTDYTDKAEWEKGIDYGTKIINEEYERTKPATKQDLHRITLLFIQNNRNNIKTYSNDFVAGMDTAIQTELQKRWDTLPAAQPVISPVAGMKGLFQVSYPPGTIPAPIKKTPIKILKKPQPQPQQQPESDPDFDPTELEI